VQDQFAGVGALAHLDGNQQSGEHDDVGRDEEGRPVRGHE
jgi:hypothetical protein